MTDHIPDATKKVGRPQIREVFLRNGFTIAQDRDDLEDRAYEAAFELLELARPAVQGESVAIPQISGIGRDTSNPRSVILYLRSEPTDDDIRTIQDALRAGCAQPADVAGLAETLIQQADENPNLPIGHWVERGPFAITLWAVAQAGYRKQGSEAPVSPPARFPDCEMECGAYGSYCRCTDESTEPSHDNQ